MKSSLKGASKVEIIYETLWLLEKRRTMLLLSLLFSRKGEGKKWKRKGEKKKIANTFKNLPGKLLEISYLYRKDFFFNDTFHVESRITFIVHSGRA